MYNEDVIDVYADAYALSIGNQPPEKMFRFATSNGASYYGAEPRNFQWQEPNRATNFASQMNSGGNKGSQGSGSTYGSQNNPNVQANEYVDYNANGPGGMNTGTAETDSFGDFAASVGTALSMASPFGAPVALGSMAAQTAAGKTGSSINNLGFSAALGIDVGKQIDQAVSDFNDFFGMNTAPDMSAGPGGQPTSGMSGPSGNFSGGNPDAYGGGTSSGFSGGGFSGGDPDSFGGGVGGSTGGFSGGDPDSYADGGLVQPGPGDPPPPPGMNTGRADNITAKVSEGEFVIPADVVRQFGIQHFEKLIQKARQPKPEAGPQGQPAGGPQGQPQRPPQAAKPMGQPKPGLLGPPPEMRSPMGAVQGF
jgi:hypothetical protein